MFPLPALAMVLFVKKSPIELPHARTVSPNTASGIPVTVPAQYSRSTSSPARISIQKIPIANPYRAISEAPIGHDVPNDQTGGLDDPTHPGRPHQSTQERAITFRGKVDGSSEDYSQESSQEEAEPAREVKVNEDYEG